MRAIVTNIVRNGRGGQVRRATILMRRSTGVGRLGGRQDYYCPTGSLPGGTKCDDTYTAVFHGVAWIRIGALRLFLLHGRAVVCGNSHR